MTDDVRELLENLVDHCFDDDDRHGHRMQERASDLLRLADLSRFNGGNGSVYMVLHALKPHLDQSGWKVFLEYPGYLAHYQEEGTEDALEIRMGIDTDWFEVQYFRSEECVGSWTIRWRDHLTIESLATAIIEGLNTAEVEE